MACPSYFNDAIAGPELGIGAYLEYRNLFLNKHLDAAGDLLRHNLAKNPKAQDDLVGSTLTATSGMVVTDEYNLVPNPDWLNGQSKWSGTANGVLPNNNPKSQITLLTPLSDPLFARGAAQIVAQVVMSNASSTKRGYATTTITGPFISGRTYTFRILVRSTVGTGANMIVYAGLAGDVATSSSTWSTSWTVKTISWTPSANRATCTVGFYNNGATGVSQTVQACNARLASVADGSGGLGSSTSTQFFDGAFDGCFWAVEQLNSTSVRPALSRKVCTWHTAVEQCFHIRGTQPADSTSRQLIFAPNGNSTGLAATPLPLGGNRSYSFSTYAKTIDGSGTAPTAGGYRWVVTWYDATGASLSTGTQTFTSDSGLNDTRLSFTALAPSTAAFAYIRIEFGTTTSSDVLEYELTAIQIEESATVTAYFDGDIVPVGDFVTDWSGLSNSSYSSIYPILGPAGEFYRITKIDGLDGPEVRDSREVNPADHGETAYDSWYSGRSIVITGRIEAGNLNMMRKMERDLKLAFGSLTDDWLYFRSADPNNDLKIFCRKLAIAIEESQSSFNYWRDFQITLRAGNPFFTSIDVNSLLANFNGSFANLQNVGDMPARPYVIFKGAVTNPILVNNTNQQQLALNIDILAGQYIRVDTVDKTIVQYGSLADALAQVNGQNQYSAMADVSDWIELATGNNSLTLTSDAATSATCTVYWEDTYL